MTTNDSTEKVEKNSATSGSNITKKQKVITGAVITIIFMVGGSVAVTNSIYSLGAILLLLGSGFLYSTVMILARKKSKEELNAEINILESKSDKNSNNDEIANNYIKIGKTHFTAHENSWAKYKTGSGDIDFSEILSALENFKWVLDNSNNSEINETVMKQLNKMVKKILEHIQYCGNDKELEVRKKYAITTAKFGNIIIPELKRHLGEYLDVDYILKHLNELVFIDYYLWIHYILFLIEDKSEDKLMIFIKAVNGSKRKSVRKNAIYILMNMNIKDKEIISELEKAVGDKNKSISKLAADAINKIRIDTV